MNDPKAAWADEPTPLCRKQAYGDPVTLDGVVPADLARDLERRLRHAAKIVGRLRADSDCGDFGTEDLEQRLKELEEVLTP